jgi:hypothetical protein
MRTRQYVLGVTVALVLSLIGVSQALAWDRDAAQTYAHDY